MWFWKRSFLNVAGRDKPRKNKLKWLNLRALPRHPMTFIVCWISCAVCASKDKYNRMNRFIETLCILDGNAMYLPWHQARVDLTFRLCMSYAKPFSIEAILVNQHDIPASGKVKCTIEYGPDTVAVRSMYYEPRAIKSLKLIEIPQGFDYRFKYADRNMIDRLYTWRGEADDILMTRNGWITDTSYANIAFLKNNRWYTPAQPLLAGTTWKRLMREGVLIARPIHQSEISGFERFKIFNALNDWSGISEGMTSSIIWNPVEIWVWCVSFHSHEMLLPDCTCSSRIILPPRIVKCVCWQMAIPECTGWHWDYWSARNRFFQRWPSIMEFRSQSSAIEVWCAITREQLAFISCHGWRSIIF